MNRLTIRNSDGSVSQPTNLDWYGALTKLADFEDEAEQREREQLECNCSVSVKSCYTCISTNCGFCVYKNQYKAGNFCSKCGRRLNK